MCIWEDVLIVKEFRYLEREHLTVQQTFVTTEAFVFVLDVLCAARLWRELCEFVSSLSSSGTELLFVVYDIDGVSSDDNRCDCIFVPDDDCVPFPSIHCIPGRLSEDNDESRGVGISGIILSPVYI